MKRMLSVLRVAGLILISWDKASAEAVTVDHYARAETDVTLGRYVQQGGGRQVYARSQAHADRPAKGDPDES